ncbi:MAG: transporter substrate-binding domain-containing protein [Alphaproteobacteria bacterium]|nr:transporter substrate-binding domain-containing protein [Alphaproteobacteria bacterium]
MKTSSLFLTFLVSAALSATAAHTTGAALSDIGPSPERPKETRLEQIKRTGMLRCGYIVWPPFQTRDHNTGKIGGPFYELTEEIGRQLKLKIEWAGEASTDHMLQDLATGRFDMLCFAVANAPGRAREAAFTRPLFYHSINLYVRKGDARFDNHFERVNQPGVRIAAMDGQFSAIAASEQFPLAKQVSLPQLSNSMDLFMMVATNKADAVPMDPHSFTTYEAANPGVLRSAKGGSLRMIAAGMPVPANEPALKAMIDTTLAYLHDSGFIDKTFKKYDSPVEFIRVAKPYQEEREITP